MEYLVAYMLVGAVLAIAMTRLEERQQPVDSKLSSFRDKIGVYLVLALAWPVSVTAIIYGALVHLSEKA